jgi:hypothetical protein
VGVDIQADNSISGNAKDINITGSNIEAQQQLSLDSAKDINIQAGYDASAECFVSWSSYHHCLLLDRWCFAG